MFSHLLVKERLQDYRFFCGCYFLYEQYLNELLIFI